MKQMMMNMMQNGSMNQNMGGSMTQDVQSQMQQMPMNMQGYTNGGMTNRFMNGSMNNGFMNVNDILNGHLNNDNMMQ